MLEDLIPPTESKPTGPQVFNRSANIGGKNYNLQIQANDDAEADSIVNTAIERKINETFNEAAPAYYIKNTTGGGEFVSGPKDINEAIAQSQERIKTQDAVYNFQKANLQLDDELEDDYLSDRLNIIDAGWAALDAVSRDVGKGVANAPTEIYNGAVTGLNEFIDTSQELLNTGVRKTLGEGAVDFGNRPIGMNDADWAALKADPNYNMDDFPYDLPTLKNKKKSVTGSLIGGIAQFASGMGVGGKLLSKWKAVSGAGKFGKAMAQGAIADFAAFDPDQNLSDLIQSVPALQNPVSEWLAGNEDDSQLELRLKNMVEGGTLGLGAEGLGVLIKSLKEYKALKTGIPEAQGQVSEAYKAVQEKERIAVLQGNAAADLLGKEGAPLVEAVIPKGQENVTIVGKRKDEAAKALEASGNTLTDDNIQGLDLAAEGKIKPLDEPHPFRVNYGAIETTDDVKNIIDTMLTTNQDYFKEIKGKPQSWQVTKMNAGRIINDPEQVNKILGRPLNQAVNAAEMNALEVLADNAAMKLREVAKVTRDAPTEANKAALQDIMSTFLLIKGSDLRAGSEAGRALNMRKALKQYNAGAFAALTNIAKSGGDVLAKANAIANMENSAEIAKNVDTLSKLNSAKQVRNFIQMMHMSAPSTQVANIMGNGANMLYEIGVRAIAGETGIGGNAIEKGEGSAMFTGLVSALNDIIRADPKVTEFVKKLDEGKFEDEVDLKFPDWAESKNPTIKTIGKIGAPVFGPIAKTLETIAPYGVKTASFGDKLSKYAASKAATEAAVFRRVQRELEAGAISPDMVSKRRAELFDAPDEAIVDEVGRFMDEVTFARRQEYVGANPEISGIRGVGRVALQAREGLEQIPYVGGLASGAVLPFINTTANISSQVIRSTPLAPLMYRYQEDIAAGGARAAIAKSRMLTGSALAWTFFSMALNGQVTGGGSSQEGYRDLQKRVGRQPYSLRIGEEYYAYDRLAPIGSLMGIAGNLGEMYQEMDLTDDLQKQRFTDNVLMFSAALGETLMDQSLMQGVSETFNMTSDVRQEFPKWLKRNIASVTTPAAVRLAERINDPYARQGMPFTEDKGLIGTLDEYLEKTKESWPGLSSKLPIRRDLWGRPVMQGSNKGAMFEIMSPYKISTLNMEPIDDELNRLYQASGGQYKPFSAPNKTLSLPDELVYNTGDKNPVGKTLDLRNRPDIYNEFLRIRGELYLPQFNELVSGGNAEYESLSNADKFKTLKKLNKEASKVAWQTLLQDENWYYEVQREVEKRYQAVGISKDELEAQDFEDYLDEDALN